ncbi:glycosyltransferase family 2 protein [Candidatus Uhrbacteria bacterium]|nr:glycosyltransferase family 2 protein [Candidatus Uhrbacteria bacterium]
MRVCLIMPMHNEEAVAERSIRTVHAHLDELPHATTMCVVDDGSRDGTPEILIRLTTELRDDRLRVVSHEVNQGYGAALRTGARCAIDGGYDYALFMDSDLTNHPRYLTLFYERMVEGWSYMKASRYAPGSAVIGVPWAHRLLSHAGNGVARMLYQIPIRDYTNGFRAVRTDLLRQMVLHERGFAIILEELCEAKRLGATFCEIPYTLTSRGSEDGRSHLSYGFRTWKHYFIHARNASRIPYRAAAHTTTV